LDLNREAGMREPDSRTHSGDLDSAGFDPAVSAVSVLGGDRDLRPGQPDELACSVGVESAWGAVSG
jgi:hypothetical protein